MSSEIEYLEIEIKNRQKQLKEFDVIAGNNGYPKDFYKKYISVCKYELDILKSILKQIEND